MRASKSEQTASAGIAAVASAFAQINWGVVENSRHDLGTDLFLLARDEQLFDLGLVLGAQGKAGQTYFREPLSEEGELKGWWFRDSNRAHVDAWASHGLPHLLILHDLDSGRSHWVHVVPEAIVSTGKGAKILVPARNTVDVEHREELLAVAAILRSSAAWEGSVWTGSHRLAAPDILRHALIVPRLVAPHPNAGHAMPLSAAQAAALVVQARLRSLEEFAEVHPEVPNLEEARCSTDWDWRLVGALGELLTADVVDGLVAAIGDAPNPGACAAAAAIAAGALLADGRADDAVRLLDDVLAKEDASPVDHAWLTCQRARARAEIGLVEQARADAASVQGVRIYARHDLTASAIAGSAAILLFNTAGWGHHDVADVIAGADTAASWWRTQTMSWALEAVADRTFKRWARDRSVTLGGEDIANNQLFAASLLASHAGDQAGWRHVTGLLGRDMLLRLDRNVDPQRARDAISVLRHAGQEKALKLAVPRLVGDGPALAVALAATEINLDAATHTTAPASLTLLQAGGDVLDQETADRTARWLLSTLRDTQPFVQRTTPSYLVELRLVEILGAVAPAASANVHHLIIGELASLSVKQQILGLAWAKVISALPADAWDEDTVRSLAASSDIRPAEFQLPILGLLARYDESARLTLIERAQAGSLDALAELGDVREIPGEAVDLLIRWLCRQVKRQAKDAREGRHGLGGSDIGSVLALLNVWHPGVAEWEPLLALLREPAVLVEDKRGALQTLGSLADRIPDRVQAELRLIAAAAAERSPAPASLFETERDNQGEGTYLATALTALDEATIADRRLGLLSGERSHRRWSAQIARRFERAEDIGILVTLSQDTDHEVRAAAGAALADIVAKQEGGAIAVAALQRCVDDPGTRAPIHVAAVLASADGGNTDTEEALQSLRDHISATVRRLAS